jgi:Ca-activated chloride channel family protein
MTTGKSARWAILLAFLVILAGVLLALAQEPVPKEEKQGPLAPPRPQQEGEQPYALRVEVPVVNVDVTVVDKNGNFITGLRREHFRVYQDGVEQEVVAFAPAEAPLTTVLLVEANPALGYLLWDNLDAAYLFLRQLRKGDWVALMSYDLRPRLEVDFTQNSQEIAQGLRHLQFGGGFREANMFDALADVLDRMKDMEGKKSVIVIGTGLNTFPKHNWDEIEKIVRENRATIFGVGMTWVLKLYYDRVESYGYNASIPRMSLLTAEAQMKALTEDSGGRSYFPRFISEMPGIYGEIGAMLRNQYSLAFQPKNLKRDGKYHKIEVKLVGPNGDKLEVRDQNGKKVKYEIYAREGYYAPEA